MVVARTERLSVSVRPLMLASLRHSPAQPTNVRPAVGISIRVAAVGTIFVSTLALLAFAGSAATGRAAAGAAKSSWPTVSFTVKPLAQRILIGADPDVAALPGGRLRLYWADANGSGSATSSDGVHFGQEPGVRLDPSLGGPHTRMVALPDGRWRMFFTDRNRHGIGSALSDDGLRFTVEPGLRVSATAAGIAPKELSAGDVVKLADGRWRMYFSSFSFGDRNPRTTHEIIKSAVSSDLLNWQVEPGIRIGGSHGVRGSGEHPAAMRLADGEIALFYGRPNPFHLYVSVSHDGLHFSSEQPLVDRSLDSAVIRRPNGSLLLYYGQAVAGGGYLNVARLVFHHTPPPPTCTVPDVRGKLLPLASRLIRRAHCRLSTVKRVASAKYASGIVIDQRPDSGSWLPNKAKVALIVSSGRS